MKFFCSRKGVDVTYAKAFKSRSDSNDANCKIVVKESDVKKVMHDNFWPGNAYDWMIVTQPLGMVDIRTP